MLWGLTKYNNGINIEMYFEFEKTFVSLAEVNKVD